MTTKKEMKEIKETVEVIIDALDTFKSEAEGYIYEAQCAIENLDGLSYDIDTISGEANNIIVLLQEKGILKDGD